MNKYLSTIFRHWKSSVTGLLVAVITVMFALGKLNAEDWILSIGGIAAVVALLSKDPDRTMSKPDKE